MSVEYENNRNEPRKAIEKTLSSQFEKLKLIETSMGGIIDSAKPFEQLKESFKCEIKADIPGFYIYCIIFTMENIIIFIISYRFGRYVYIT